MNTNTSFVVRNKNARTLRLIGEKIVQLASLAERADEVGRPLKVDGGLMLHEISDDKRDEIVYVLQVGDSEMRITVDTHTLELVGRKGFYRMGNVMPEPIFELGNVESPYDAAVKHFADVGFSPARYSDLVSDGGMDPRNAPAPAQDERENWNVALLQVAVVLEALRSADSSARLANMNAGKVLGEAYAKLKGLRATRPAQAEQQKYDEVLLPFLDLMRAELRANAGKGDRPGWLSISRETCLLEIYYHLAKLQKATIEDSPSGIREHAADVANMSMMLVDICGLLTEQGETK